MSFAKLLLIAVLLSIAACSSVIANGSSWRAWAKNLRCTANLSHSTPLKQAELMPNFSTDELAAAERILKEQRLDVVRFAVGTNGQWKPATAFSELHFQESPNIASISVFGLPYELNGELWLDVRLVQTFDQKYLDKVALLKPIRLTDYYASVRDEYFEYRVKAGGTGLFYPKGSAFAKLVKIEGVSEHGVRLRFPNSRKVEVSKEEFFLSNIFVQIEELALLEKINSVGGVVRVDIFDPLEARESAYRGLQIHFLELPQKEKAIASGLVYDAQTYDQLRVAQKLGIDLILATSDKGHLAVALTSAHSLNARLPERWRKKIKNFMIFTPVAESSVIVHELRHIQDVREKELEGFQQWLDKMMDVYSLDQNHVLSLFHLISEQRAYARQFEFLEGLLKTSSSDQEWTIRSWFSDSTVNTKDYVAYQKKLHQEMMKRYIVSAKEALNGLGITQKQEYLDWIGKKFYPSIDLSAEKIQKELGY